MSRKIKVRDTYWNVYRGFSQISEKKKWGYRSGVVYTKHGIVKVYTQWDQNPKSRFTLIEFVVGGVCYTQHYNKEYTDRYLVTLAKRFAKEMTEKHGGK